jgi:hypothetical protein
MIHHNREHEDDKWFHFHKTNNLERRIKNVLLYKKIQLLTSDECFTVTAT